jgi:CelD/BcsL family acetyltransferase involved in cellulose biosynthesis
MLNNDPLTVRFWSDTEFAGSRAAWDDLLGRSNADSLFMSWDWQRLWWESHRNEIDSAELRLVAAYDAAGALIGLAPMFSCKTRYFSFLPIVRLCVIGQNWRDSSVTFSEYLDVIADRSHASLVAQSLVHFINNMSDWHELTCSANLGDSVFRKMLPAGLGSGRLVREIDAEEAFCLPLPLNFQAFLDGMSSGVRRRAYKERRKFESLSFEQSGPEDVEAAFDLLQKYRRLRWNPSLQGVGGTTSENRIAFHRELAIRLSRAGELRMSVLKEAGSPISVMYCIRRNNREYFLQSGFDLQAKPTLSVGYLHIGYCIEAACEDGIKCFDFLIGTGKNHNYKRDFRALATPVSSIQIVRAWHLRLLYFVHSWLVRRRLIRA